MRKLSWFFFRGAGLDDWHHGEALCGSYVGQPVQLHTQMEGLVEAFTGIPLEDAFEVQVARAMKAAEFSHGVRGMWHSKPAKVAADLGRVPVRSEMVDPAGQPEREKPGGLEMRGHGDSLVLFQQPRHEGQLAGMADFIDNHEPVAAKLLRVRVFPGGPDPLVGFSRERGVLITEKSER